jgi:hypothetical protein
MKELQDIDSSEFKQSVAIYESSFPPNEIRSHQKVIKMLQIILKLDSSLEMYDLGSLIEGELSNRIFKDTNAARDFLKHWCCK